MKTRIAKLALGVVLLVLVAAPRFASAAVVVAEPTGDAAPAVAVADGKSATGESSPLPVKYDRRKALLTTVLPTALAFAVGGALIPISFCIRNSVPLVTGSIILGNGLILGPSVGYFWIGRTRHGLAMSGLRFLTLAIGVTAMCFYIAPLIGNDDEEEGRAGPSPTLLTFSILSYTATLFLAFVDASLVGRAADRANAQWREKNKPTVQVTPVAWSNGNGDGTFGLAVSGAF